MAWTGTNDAHSLCVAEVPITPAGASELAHKVILNETSDHSPALASAQTTLYLAWTGMNDAHSLCVLGSPDNGNTFFGKFVSVEASDSAPALVSHNNQLFIAWRGHGNVNLSVARVPMGLTVDFKDKVILTETSDNSPAGISRRDVVPFVEEFDWD